MGSMGYLGPCGTHSEAAAIFVSRAIHQQELKGFPDIYSVMQAVSDGEVDSSIVPVENSLEGSINITLDFLARNDTLEVACELVWPVHNYLMAKKSSCVPHTIVSHAQPLSQCRNYIKSHFPAADLVAAQSTAHAAKMVSQSADDECAAICTKRAGDMYGLSVIAENIQDNMMNSTRLFVVKKKTCDHFRVDISSEVNDMRGKDKVIVICKIDGSHAGALASVLDEFAWRKVNMVRIESRPARTRLGEYVFFFDLEADAPEGALESSIRAVEKKCIWLRLHGPFPVMNVFKS